MAAALAFSSACTPSERAQAPGASSWTVVERRAELQDALAQAGSRRVLVDVSAEWCVPCTAMRSLTFADERVQTALSDYATIEVDVSEESPEQMALSDFFGATALPCVVRFDDARALHAAVANKQRIAPKPSLRLHTFVEPDELL
ncbi:MAG TPA: thioredoxin family protein, partial [Nannocystaceae bacterium]|nr:thioredoxin family protein [Nannocystaceae bacterium]